MVSTRRIMLITVPRIIVVYLAVKCRACGDLAEGNVITVLGDTYHQQCFNCSKCG